MAEIGTFDFINRADYPVWLLEGVEGVYKLLARLPPTARHHVRGINGSTTECHYLVFVDEPSDFVRVENSEAAEKWIFLDSRILHVHPNSDCTRVYCRQSMSEFTFFLEYSAHAEHVTWYNRFRVPGFNIRQCFQSLIEGLITTRITLSMDGEYAMPLFVIEAIHRQEIRSLLQIKPNLDHTDGSAALELWESKEKVLRLEIENVQAELKDYGNIMFQLVIGFYTVVHGLLFTVVSQPGSPFTCGKIRVSYIVSSIISFITIVGIIKNVKAMEDLKKLIYDHRARILALCRWQSTLKRQGDRFVYGHATLDYKPMPTMKVWLLPAFLPLKAVFYTFLILMCSALICYLMHLLQCGE